MLPTIVWFSGAAQAFEEMDIYRLRQGDSVLISVWREENLQLEVRVLPDGSVTFPLVGRIVVAGLSTPEAEKRIAEKLSAFIPDPEVSVVITGIEGNRIYVIGKVTTPGAIVLNGPMTALQALSLVGGLDRFANGDGVQVLRTALGAREVLPVRYNELIKGRSLSTNVELQAGDIILVP